MSDEDYLNELREAQEDELADAEDASSPEAIAYVDGLLEGLREVGRCIEEELVDYDPVAMTRQLAERLSNEGLLD